MNIEHKKHLLEMRREYNFEALPEHFGGRVPITNMLRDARQGRLTVEKLNDEFENLIYNLQCAKNRALELINITSTCEHKEFKPSTYTYQRRILGYVFVYERRCSGCGFMETFTRCDDNEKIVELPDWTVGAKQQYYNNDY